MKPTQEEKVILSDRLAGSRGEDFFPVDIGEGEILYSNSEGHHLIHGFKLHELLEVLQLQREPEAICQLSRYKIYCNGNGWESEPEELLLRFKHHRILTATSQTAGLMRAYRDGDHDEIFRIISEHYEHITLYGGNGGKIQ